ncbi:MAG: NAD(P)-dependent alcohol dehydrogenase [Rhodococcus sp. (in: high G+C Gram-positive bacteria)]|uniref:NAD(P)-dependent alcohol dehydrogenase n=1 Tax=Rhodococcus sp. TaxID=1831 RepID=UPI003BB1532E
MRANAAVLDEVNGTLHRRPVSIEDLRSHEVLVRMAGVGICHTDLTAMSGGVPLRFPTVLGHEGAGVVVATGPDSQELSVGDHVVLSFDSCRDCVKCRRGRPAYCARFAALNYGGLRPDGTATMRDAHAGAVHGNWFGQSSFSTLAVASTRNAVKVPVDVPLELLGPLGCGIQTGAGAVMEVMRPESGTSIAVFGAGPVGLSAVMAAVVAGCTSVIAVDPSPQRRALAEALGATAVVDPEGHPRTAKHIREVAGGGVDYSVDTVSTESVIQHALAVLDSPGTCVTLGLRGQKNPVAIDQSHLLMGRTLTGVIEGDVDPHLFVPRLIDLWREGRFPFDKMITTYPFAQIGTAIADAREGRVAKAVLTFEEEISE